MKGLAAILQLWKNVLLVDVVLMSFSEFGKRRYFMNNEFFSDVSFATAENVFYTTLLGHLLRVRKYAVQYESSLCSRVNCNEVIHSNLKRTHLFY